MSAIIIDAVERDSDGRAIKVVAVVGHIEIAFIAKKKERTIKETYRINFFGGSSYISPVDWKELTRKVYMIFYEK